MSWLYESRRVDTHRNGPMKLTRLLGRWTLRTPDWTQQSSPYIDTMWRNTLRAVRRRGTPVRRCLALGVGLGGIFMNVRATFPDAEIVGVDWDAELAEIGKNLGIYDFDERVQIVIGDASDVVPALGGEFDLVLADLFVGTNHAPILHDPTFQDVVVQKITPWGVLCVNGYNKHEVFDGWKARMRPEYIVHYRMNDVLVFSKR